MARGNGRGRGQGRGQGGNLAGPGGYCVCPSCGYKESHTRGVPCMNKTCPKCGAKMSKNRNIHKEKQ